MPMTGQFRSVCSGFREIQRFAIYRPRISPSLGNAYLILNDTGMFPAAGNFDIMTFRL